MGTVRAGFLDIGAVVTSDGSLTEVDFGDPSLLAEELDAVASDTHATAGKWYDVRHYTELSCMFHANIDNNGANTCSFTVEAVESRYSTTAEAFDLQAAFAVGADTIDRATVNKKDIRDIGYIRVLENGTDADRQRITVLAK